VYGPQPATLLFERITIRQLADHLRVETPAPTSPAPTSPAPAEPRPARPARADDAERLVASLSDAAVDELLAELLSQHGEPEEGGR
jgi:polyketide synthase PksN